MLLGFGEQAVGGHDLTLLERNALGHGGISQCLRDDQLTGRCEILVKCGVLAQARGPLLRRKALPDRSGSRIAVDQDTYFIWASSGATRLESA